MTQFIEHVLNNINHTIFILDKNGCFIFVNNTMSKQCGYSKNELLEMNISDIDIGFNKVEENTFWKKLNHKKQLRIHTIYKDKFKNQYPVLIRAYYINYGHNIYSLCVVEDENYIQAFLDIYDSFVILTDGKTLYAANRKTVEFFNYQSLISFKANHSCISDFFIDESGFINNMSTWLEEVKKNSHNGLKVKIKKIDTQEVLIFLVRASLFDTNRYLVTFTDITELEEYKNRLEHLAFTDALTSLFNRYHFNKILPQEINRTKRCQKHLAFIILDIDFFKQYNDTYGHINGDSALIKVANTIQKSFRRASDFCFRLGGEEFGVICTVNSSDEIKKRAEHLLISIENLRIKHEKSTVSTYVTVSIGIAIYENTISQEDLYSFADIELYKAKESGRNRISLRNNL